MAKTNLAAGNSVIMHSIKIAFNRSKSTARQARCTISVSIIALLVFVCALPVFASVDGVNKDLRKVVSDLGKTKTSQSSGRVEGPRDISLFNVEPTDVIPLHLFVSKRFDAAAQLIQMGNTKKAMTLLRKIDVSQSYAAAESHYLKALCLQSLRKFPESCAEYLLVESYSRDSSLSVKAKLGHEQSQAKQHSINRNLLFFPRTWYPGLDVRMTK